MTPKELEYIEEERKKKKFEEEERKKWRKNEAIWSDARSVQRVIVGPVDQAASTKSRLIVNSPCAPIWSVCVTQVAPVLFSISKLFFFSRRRRQGFW